MHDFFADLVENVIMKKNITATLLVDRIDSLLEARKEKRKALTDAIGISSSSLSTWAARGTLPSADVCYSIAQYFGVSMEYLITGTDTRYGVTSERIRVIVSDLERLESRDLMHVAALIHSIADKAEQNAARMDEVAEDPVEYYVSKVRTAGDVVSLGMHEKDRLTGVKKTPGVSEESAG